MSAQPNRASVMVAMEEFLSTDKQVFFRRHSSGHGPRSHYVLHDGRLFPVKALWAAAHRPSVQTSAFQTAEARRGLRKLGFKDFEKISDDDQFDEGERRLREVQSFARNLNLVVKAKRYYGMICAACGFDFASKYGELGADYIECHHINPLSGRDGETSPTTVNDVTVLCANCHRMIHRRKPALTLPELKDALRRAGKRE